MRVGSALWHVLTSVRFAVLQIILLVVAGLIGTIVRQLPAFALRDPNTYATEMAAMHARYDPLTVAGANIGPGMVMVFERLGFFRIFTAPWFSALLTLLVLSIVVCTLDRTPRLWRGVHTVRPVQPEPFFDSRLPHRSMAVEGPATSPDAIARLLRRRRYKVRLVDAPDASFVYADRNQYFRMATLLTHLGLILFLLGGAVTGAFGFETVLFVGEGQTAPVEPVGTPHNLLVKNLAFEAPQRADGSFEDYRTDLAVYQDGREVARKTIRVNDPLTYGGFVFHQNTFGPAANLDIHDASGHLVFTGPLLLAGSLLGKPQGFLTIPGSDTGMVVLLDRDAAHGAQLSLLGLQAAASGSESVPVFRSQLGLGATTDSQITGGYSITWSRVGAFTGMVVKDDPGQSLIWVAFACLISGIILSFYFPRRRVWARYASGRVQLAMLADRYVDTDREFAQLLSSIGVQPAPGDAAP